MANSINVSCPLSFRTQFWVSQLIFARSRAGIFMYGVFLVMPLLCLVVMPMQNPQWVSQRANWIGLLLMPALPLVVLPLLTALNIRRLRQRHAWLRGVLQYVISEDAFEAHGDGFDVRLRWDVVLKVIETRNYFLFYVSPVAAHIIPKACAASPADVEDLRRIVHTALGTKRRSAIKRAVFIAGGVVAVVLLLPLLLLTPWAQHSLLSDQAPSRKAQFVFVRIPEQIQPLEEGRNMKTL